jgi:hypothetical protein
MDDPRYALDRGPTGRTLQRDRVAERQRHVRVALYVLQLLAEQRAGVEVYPLAVVERDQRVRDWSLVAADDRQLAHQGDLEHPLDRCR